MILVKKMKKGKCPVKFLPQCMGYFACICVVLLLAGFFPAAGVSAPLDSEKMGTAIKKDVPTNIKANAMQYDAHKLTVVFDGNVRVRRPDFDMDAKKLIIYLKPAPKKEAAPEEKRTFGSGMEAGEIDRMVASGNVHITKDNRTGDAQKVTFYMDDGLLVMEGEPVLQENKNTIRGTTIKFYTQENRSEVVGSHTTPVEVVFSVPASQKK